MDSESCASMRMSDTEENDEDQWPCVPLRRRMGVAAESKTLSYFSGAFKKCRSVSLSVKTGGRERSNERKLHCVYSIIADAN